MNRRLMGLTMVLLILASLRYAWWSRSDDGQIVQALNPSVAARQASGVLVAAAPISASAQPSLSPAAALPIALDAPDTSVPNLFISRKAPTSPPAVSPPPRQVAPPIAAVVVPAPPTAPTLAETAPPPAPPVPFQVIGVWRDDEGARVFLAAPSGTMQARVGDALLGYRLQEIAPQKITLLNLSTQRQVAIDAPAIGQPLADNRTTMGTP